MNERKSEPRLRVLLIDDEPSVFEGLDWIFKTPLAFPATLEWERTLGAGIARALQSKPDVVLLDLKIPKESPAGEEALGAIIQLGAISAVIVLTGHGSLSFHYRAIDNSAMDLIDKMFALDPRERKCLWHSLFNATLLHQRIYPNESRR